MNNIGTKDYYFRIFSNSKSLDIDAILDFLAKRESSQITVQIIDPTFIVSERQLQSAIYHVEKSFENKRNIARNKGSEFIIRLTGKRQISSALKQIGIQKNGQYLLAISFGSTLEKNIEELEKLVNQFDLNKIEIEKTLPLSNLDSLSIFYECLENYEEIEKRALERIASIEIL
jgi:tRNA threonylcarbamoyladenosine modification (KEOPS) complex Cgi121 subunit